MVSHTTICFNPLSIGAVVPTEYINAIKAGVYETFQSPLPRVGRSFTIALLDEYPHIAVSILSSSGRSFLQTRTTRCAWATVMSFNPLFNGAVVPTAAARSSSGTVMSFNPLSKRDGLSYADDTADGAGMTHWVSIPSPTGRSFLPNDTCGLHVHVGAFQSPLPRGGLSY